MNIDLKDKVALITGASRGIGKSISLVLAALGTHVVLVARSRGKLEKIKNTIELKGGRASIIKTDLLSEKEIASLFDRINKQFGKIDILVNNAGMGIHDDFEKLTLDDLDKVMNLNLKSIFSICQKVLPLMISNRNGYIINIASVQGVKGYPRQTIYAASKHAVMGFTKALAAEVQKDHIKVSAILPGGTDTDLIAEAMPGLDRAILIKPEDIARTVVYLLSLSESAMVDQVLVRRMASQPFG